MGVQGGAGVRVVVRVSGDRVGVRVGLRVRCMRIVRWTCTDLGLAASHMRSVLSYAPETNCLPNQG